jgi:hypothetical protein
MTAHFSRYFGSFVFVRRTPKLEFSLTPQPEKTRLIEFGRHGATNRKRRGLGKPETFTFVGFTLFCGKSARETFWFIGRPDVTA